MSKQLTSQKRWPALILVALVTGVIALAACGNGSVETILETAEASAEEITVGISMYVLVDDLENPDPAISSRRSEEELTVILAGMNEIWGQANIRLELDTLDTIAVDPDVLDHPQGYEILAEIRIHHGAQGVVNLFACERHLVSAPM